MLFFIRLLFFPLLEFTEAEEKITIKNSTASSVDLTGWKIEVKGKKQILSGNISAGQSKTINVNGQVVLTNNGATINLLNTNLQLVHSVSYKKQDVKKGTPILF